MKVKATKDVHIRSGESRRNGNANLKGILYKGFSIEVTEVKTDGEDIDGNSTWYKDRNGDWYWSGGFESSEHSGIKANYNSAFSNIPEAIRKTKGSGVRVALIDTGIDYTHDCFRTPVSTHKESPFGTTDDANHGTFLGGIICANNHDLEDGIIGLAPDAELFVSKAINNVGLYGLDNITQSFDWALNVVKADVINFSLNIFDYKTANAERFDDLVAEAEENDVLLVTSAGENLSLKSCNLHPASIEDFISVGAISEGNQLKVPLSSLDPCIDLILPNNSKYSSIPLKNRFSTQRGSSVSAAIISAYAALLIAHKKRKVSKNEFLESIRGFSEAYSTNADLSSTKFYYHEKASIHPS